VFQLLAALIRAWEYVSYHSDTVTQWYIDDAQLGYTREALASAAKIDPNWSAKSLREIDLRLTEEHIADFERGAAWQYSTSTTNSNKVVSGYVRPSTKACSPR
jgi:hypothetical protein